MDKATEEFNKANQALLEAKIKLNTANAQVNTMDKEIALLQAVESQLIQNIRILKSKPLVIVVSEYKKAFVDLRTARSRISLAKIEREGIFKLQRRAQVEYDKAKSRYDVAYEAVYNPPNNVIQGFFGRKNDGQG